jgi:putative addiction module CopG family antidote
MGIVLDPQLESRIAAKVRSGRYRSADEVVEKSLSLLDERESLQDASAEAGETPIWETIARLCATVPDEELAKLPTDLSVNIDHYLYGAPKRTE